MNKQEKVESVQVRAQKKAARRAAFIQEIAGATARLVCGSVEPTPTTPFGIAYQHEWRAEREAEKREERREETLDWAVAQGLLPAGTTELPTVAVQQYLLETYAPGITPEKIRGQAEAVQVGIVTALLHSLNPVSA